MKIPDDVFENRCRWCIHGRVNNGNEEVPGNLLHKSSYHDKLPCNIMGIAKCEKVTGECLSFHPHWIYGICQTCAFDNMFHEGFCTHPAGPANKRQVFLGSDFTADNYYRHYRSTCDRYQVAERCKNTIMANVLAGKAPANFDPDTWEPLELLDGSPQAAEWCRMQEQARTERESKAEKQKAKRDAFELSCAEQIAMKDFLI